MNDRLKIDLDACLAVNPSMVLRVENDDCALLFDPVDGRVHVLNPTAVAVWQRLDGRSSLRAIIAMLADDFDGMGPEVETQILTLAQALAGLGAIGFVREPQ